MEPRARKKQGDEQTVEMDGTPSERQSEPDRPPPGTGMLTKVARPRNGGMRGLRVNEAAPEEDGGKEGIPR